MRTSPRWAIGLLAAAPLLVGACFLPPPDPEPELTTISANPTYVTTGFVPGGGGGTLGDVSTITNTGFAPTGTLSYTPANPDFVVLNECPFLEANGDSCEVEFRYEGEIETTTVVTVDGPNVAEPVEITVAAFELEDD